MLNFTKIIFIDGGEPSGLLNLLTSRGSAITLSIPGDLQLDEAIDLIQRSGLDFIDQTIKQRVSTELFLSGGPVPGSTSSSEEKEVDSNFYRSGVLKEEDISAEENSDQGDTDE